MHDLSALERAARLRSGAVSVVEHIDSVFARIAARDPHLNAFSHLNPAARGEALRLDQLAPAARADKPLFGVPVAVKEEIDVAGMITTVGGCGNSTPVVADSAVVARLRDAGAIVVGKTHMPEFGQDAFTGGAWGQTRNPYDTSRNSGGSSGGSAVAVASGMVPIALGGDGGGSIRIPAAWSGVVGLKPGRGRVTTDPHPHLWYALGTYGPLAQTVDDVEAVLDIIADALAPAPPSRWRVGWTLQASVPGLRPQTELADAVRGAAAELAALGHEVRQGRLRYRGTPLAFLIQCYLGVLNEEEEVEHPELLERRTRQLAALGRRLPAGALDWALRATADIEEAAERVFRHIDVLLTPVTPTVARPRGPIPAGTWGTQLRSASIIAYTSYWNLAGNPAVSVPVGISSEGLPLAVQVIARHGQERTALAAARALRLDASRGGPAMPKEWDN